MKDARIEETILEMVTARAPKTVCPSEVARRLSKDDWRALMDPVRRAAGQMPQIEVTQQGIPVAWDAAGPLRFGLAYRIGRGEEGVLTLEPWKSELLPLWHFATPALARRSCADLWKRFMRYGRAGDFPGMDMARKFLQMGLTRATRYARHASGRIHGESGRLPEQLDAEKAESAAIFRAAWERARKNPTYLRLKRDWQALHRR